MGATSIVSHFASPPSQSRSGNVSSSSNSQSLSFSCRQISFQCTLLRPAEPMELIAPSSTCVLRRTQRCEKQSRQPMSNLKDRTKATNKHALIIGDSGSGKTSFLGTVPGIQIADFDSGLDVLAGKNVEYTEYFDGEKPSAWLDFKAELDAWKKEPKGPALGLDSITTAAECALKY